MDAARSRQGLRGLAITLLDGGDALRHMGVLAAEPEVFIVVGSAATVWPVRPSQAPGEPEGFTATLVD